MAKITKAEIDEAAVLHVLGVRDHYEQLRKDSNKYQEWDMVDKAFNNDVADFYKGVARVRVPALHNAIENSAPRFDKINFPPDGNFFRAEAKDKTDDLSVDDAQRVTTLIKQQFMDVNVRGKLIPSYRSYYAYGTVFFDTLWDKRIQQRFKREDGERKKVWETVFDNPDFHEIPIRDVYIDTKDENLSNSTIIRKVKNFQDLWQLRDDVDNGIFDTDNLKQLKEVKFIQSVKKEDKEADANKRMDNHRFSDLEHKVEVLFYQGDVPLWMLTGKMEDKESGAVEKEAIIEIAGADDNFKLLRIDDNPFDHGEKSLIRGRAIVTTGNGYGTSPIVISMPLQAELNTLRSQEMDNRTFMLRKKWLKDRGAQISDDDLKDLDNQVINTDDVNGLRELNVQDFTPSTRAAQDVIKQDLKESTKDKDLISGTPIRGNLERTAAGVATVSQAALEPFELMASQYQQDILKPLVRKFWQLNQQFLPEGRDVALVGAPIIRVVPEEISLDGLDLNFNGVDELGQRDFRVNAINIALQNIPALQPLGLDPVPLALELLRLLGLGKILTEVDKRPETQLEHTPQGEVQLLSLGQNVRIDLNDNHVAFLRGYESLLGQQILVDPAQDIQAYAQEFVRLAQSADIPENVRANLLEAVGQRLKAMTIITEGVKDTPNV